MHKSSILRATGIRDHPVLDTKTLALAEAFRDIQLVAETYPRRHYIHFVLPVWPAKQRKQDYF